MVFRPVSHITHIIRLHFHFGSQVTPRKVNRGIMASFRSIAERIHDSATDPKDAKAQQRMAHAKQDYENAILFLRSQREHAVSLCSAQSFYRTRLDGVSSEFLDP